MGGPEGVKTIKNNLFFICLFTLGRDSVLLGMAMRIAVGDRDPDCNVRPRSGCMYICMYVCLNLFSA